MCDLAGVGLGGNELGGADKRYGAAADALVVEHRSREGVDAQLHRAVRGRPPLPTHPLHLGAQRTAW